MSALVSCLDNEVPTLDKYATRERAHVAVRRANGRFVTVAVTAMSFQRLVCVPRGGSSLGGDFGNIGSLAGSGVSELLTVGKRSR